MIKDKNKFNPYVSTGNCQICKQKTTLDKMIKNDNTDLYECIDCKIINENNNYNQSIDNNPIPINRLKKLVGFLMGCFLIFGFLPSMIAAPLITDGLYSYFNFTSNANDYYLRYGNSTPVNVVHTSEGFYDYGYYFNGVNSSIAIGHNSEYGNICNNGCSFCLYVKLNDTTPLVQSFIAKFDVLDNNKYFRFNHYGVKNQIIFSITKAGSSTHITEGIYNLTENFTNDYHLYCGVYNGSTTQEGIANIYIDGKLAITQYSGTAVNIDAAAWLDHETTYIGLFDDSSPSSNNYLYGIADEIYIFNRTLTDTELYYIYDPTPPQILYMNATRILDDSNYEIENSTFTSNGYLDINISDDILLFSFNLSIGDCNGWSHKNYTENLNTTLFNIHDFIDLGGFTEGDGCLNLTVCDGHTSQLIPEFKEKKLSDGITFDNINITVNHVEFSTVETIKKTDRINYNFVFNKPIISTFFKVTSKDKIYYYNNSLYSGWLVSGKKWVDFVSNNISVTSVIKNTDYEYLVFVNSVDDKPITDFNFNSVGAINCINTSIIFYIDFDDDNVTLHNPDDETYTVNNTYLNLEFNYTPFYLPNNPDNCTLFVNDSLYNFSSSIQKNIINHFKYNFNYPPPQNSYLYDYYIICSHIHNYGGQYEVHTKQSDTNNFTIFNTAVTTSSTSSTSSSSTSSSIATSTTIGDEDKYNVIFTSSHEGFYYMFLIFIWLIVLYMFFTLTGKNGEKIGFLNLLQVFLGFVAGSSFVLFNFIVGFTIMLVSVGLFIGSIMER